MSYYDCSKRGGGYVIDLPSNTRGMCPRDDARPKRTSDASYKEDLR